ncbi:MAG: hypothetical protein F4Y44_05425 [Chloroflexi bacterium]|nr:hypothetical protein [Chloroflexota bacterium]
MTNLWKENVGTQANPVSYLHEYAVAMIWEALHSQAKVFVVSATGETSSDLRDGMARCAIPDETTAIAGTIPDLAIYNSDHRPIRVIEVDYTSKTKEDVIQRRHNLRVETVVVDISSEKDLYHMILDDNPFNRNQDAFMPDSGSLNQHQWYNYKPVLMGEDNRTFMPDMEVVNQVVVNILQQQEFLRRQREADDTIRNIMHALVSCSPQVRREFRDMMSAMNSVHALYPISAANPKFEVLSKAYRTFTDNQDQLQI